MESTNLLVVSTAIDAVCCTLDMLHLAGCIAPTDYGHFHDNFTVLKYYLSRGLFSYISQCKDEICAKLDVLREIRGPRDQYFAITGRACADQIQILFGLLINNHVQLHTPQNQARINWVDYESDIDSYIEEEIVARHSDRIMRYLGVRHRMNHERFTSSESSLSSRSASVETLPEYEAPPSFEESTANLPNYDESQRDYAARLGARPRIAPPPTPMSHEDREILFHYASGLGVVREEVNLSETFLHSLFEEPEDDETQFVIDSFIEPAFITGISGFTRSENALGFQILVPDGHRRHGATCPGCKFNLPHCEDFVIYQNCCRNQIHCCAHWCVNYLDYFSRNAETRFLPINAYEQIWFYKANLPNRDN